MRILVIEDEPAAVRRIIKLIGEINPGHEVVAALSSIELAVEWLNTQPSPDAVLMDIHLADGSAFDIFEQTQIQAPVIFATAYDEFALKAFQVNAIDYLLKPIKKADLEKALGKVTHSHKLDQAESDLIARLAEAGFIQRPNRILVRVGQGLKLIDLDQVAWFYSKDKMSFAVLANGKKYPVDKSLDQLEQQVNRVKYFRINRRCIVGLSAIEEMMAYSTSRLKLKLQPPTDEEIIISKERTPEFKKWLVGEE
jgi:two-component system response regulator LytT